VYWAVAKVLKQPKDPRQPPFMGHPGVWEYQHPMMGGRAGRGGAVADFRILPGNVVDGEILIRVRASRYHLFTDASRRAVEGLLLTRMARFGRVVDVYEQDSIRDDSAQAVIRDVRRALDGGKSQDPRSAGTAKRL